MDSDGTVDYCKFYMPEFVDSENTTCSKSEFSSNVVSCPQGGKFTFNNFEFEETLVTKWESVCDGDSPPISIIQMFYISGLLIGSFVSGKLGDSFGRKPALMFSILLSSGGELLGCFMPEIYSYSVAR